MAQLHTGTRPLHPSLVLRSITSNVVPIWRAIDDDAEVPDVKLLDAPNTLAIWREGQQPHFQTLEVRLRLCSNYKPVVRLNALRMRWQRLRSCPTQAGWLPG